MKLKSKVYYRISPEVIVRSTEVISVFKASVEYERVLLLQALPPSSLSHISFLHSSSYIIREKRMFTLFHGKDTKILLFSRKS